MFFFSRLQTLDIQRSWKSIPIIGGFALWRCQAPRTLFLHWCSVEPGSKSELCRMGEYPPKALIFNTPENSCFSGGFAQIKFMYIYIYIEYIYLLQQASSSICPTPTSTLLDVHFVMTREMNQLILFSSWSYLRKNTTVGLSKVTCSVSVIHHCRELENEFYLTPQSLLRTEMMQATWASRRV